MRLVSITSASITAVLLAAALGACGSVHDRAGCGASTDCPVGQYCAHTSNGNVCWGDSVPPAVSGVSVACLDPVVDGSTCLRDGVLRVQATITDDREVLGAEVQLDVGGAPVPLVRAGGDRWTADVRLATLPFDFFEHAVVTTVVATDGARNRVFEPAVSTTVTRHVWKSALGAALGSPAVSATGVLAVPASSGRVHFLTWDGSSLGSVELAAGTVQGVTAATSVGASFWVGADDGHVYKLSAIGGVWTGVTQATAGGAIKASLASTSNGTIIAASASGIVYAVTENTVATSIQGLALTAGPVVDLNDHFFGIASGYVRRLRLQGGVPTDDWGSPAVMGGNVADPVACTTALIAAVNTGTDGVLKRLSASADPEVVGTAALPAGGVSVLADGSILVPEQTKTLSRWTSTGAPYPGWQKPDLGAAPRTPLVTTSAAPFLVPTENGALHALRSNGSVAWSCQLTSGIASLQPGNIYTRPLQALPGLELSTAYFAGSDGVLHAVIVDGVLDSSAPWPKAFHDPRNTNRAGAQP